MTRRDALKGAVGLAALGALPASAAGSGRPRPGRERVAIIGAGAGGVAAAYFLAGSFDVDLFEARSRIGGHCDSRVIKHRGRRITVDLGAQFFHPDTHPIYVTLLEELGLYDPSTPAPTPRCRLPRACASSGRPGARPSSRRRTRLRRRGVRSTLRRSLNSRGRRSCRTCRGRSPSTPGSAACRCGEHSRRTSCIRGSRRRSGVRGATRGERRRGRSCRRSRSRFRPTFSRAPPRTPRRSACRGTCSGCWTAARPPRCTSARLRGPSVASAPAGSCGRRRAGRGRTGSWC